MSILLNKGSGVENIKRKEITGSIIAAADEALYEGHKQRWGIFFPIT
jgi:hypothetical protein